MHLPGTDAASLVGLVVGGSLAWALTYGFAVWFDLDAPFTGRRLAAVAAGGGVAALALGATAVGLSSGIAAVSGIRVSPWLSLWVVAGPLGLLLTLAYHDRVGGDEPAQWLGLGAVAGFAVWPVVEYLAVVVAVAVLG